jgi:type IV pilus assembly protein PilE
MNDRRGFTLIELMVVVAIVAILASVAIPSYQTYVMRGNRTDGITPLQSTMNAQERYYTDNRTYTINLGTGGLNIGPAANSPLVSGDYSITAQQCKDAGGTNISLTLCIELKATASGNQVDDGNLYLNTQGRQERVVNEGASDEYIADF